MLAEITQGWSKHETCFVLSLKLELIPTGREPEFRGIMLPLVTIDGTIGSRFFRNVGTYQITWHNIPEDRNVIIIYSPRLFYFLIPMEFCIPFIIALAGYKMSSEVGPPKNHWTFGQTYTHKPTFTLWPVQVTCFQDAIVKVTRGAELFKHLCEKSERTQSLLESGVLPLRGGARFRITFAATKLLNKESDNFRFQGRTRPTEGPRLTLRRLMSYIYGAPILDVSRSHTTTQHSR